MPVSSWPRENSTRPSARWTLRGARTDLHDRDLLCERTLREEELKRLQRKGGAVRKHRP